ncbi:hypothetical protein BGX24_006871 [Mortierella sp. AD032]|nr:hypothetical protein BGX24_006871 [Mortierella sp. AD032]
MSSFNGGSASFLATSRSIHSGMKLDRTVSNLDKDICTYILDLLRQIDDLSDLRVPTHARSQLQVLAIEGDTAKQILYRDIMAVRRSSPLSSTLLGRAQAVLKVDHALFRLRAMRLNGPVNDLYIPPLAKPTSRSGDNSLFPLMDNTLSCLASACQVLLLLGDSGGGKLAFNLQLENTLWQSYKRDAPIPLHINLPTIDNPHENMIAKRLQQLNFSEAQIQELKQQREFIVICDGYDESQLNGNLYTTNNFNQAGQWNVKLGPTIALDFIQMQNDTSNISNNKRSIASSHQIKEYAEQYVTKVPQNPTVPNQQNWSSDDYMDKSLKINGLMELVSNPFLLSLALTALPMVVRSEMDISKIRLTRVSLYDNFMAQWLESNKLRLQHSRLSSKAQVTFGTLRDADFIQYGIDYQKDLAAAIFQHQAGKPAVDYVHLRESRSWKARFFGLDPQVTLLRESSPLTRSGNQYRFLHRSLLEYLYSRFISDPFDLGDNPTDNDPKAVTPRNILARHPLNQRNIVGERSILQFLAERVNSIRSFKTFLLDVIKASKVDDGVNKAAANAMSILVRAGVRFNGEDLSGVRIPGANLRYGQFDCADLRGADLTGVNLSKAWLRRADLSGAIMGGVEFEELPYLEASEGVKSCVFSSDGKLLIVCSHQCSIDVYNTATWEKKDNLLGKSAIAISPNCKEFANATLNNDAEVVNIESGVGVLILSGHRGSIESICYSPDGNLIATGSKDKTVRMWQLSADVYSVDNVDTADAVHVLRYFRVLRGHSHTVTSVAFSPSGLRFASCSLDKTIRIIDVKTSTVKNILDCAAPVLALAYSPDGRQLASCGQDTDLRLWNTISGNADHFLKGHIGTVFALAFSPDGRQVASCGESGVIYFWDTRNGLFLDVLSGDRYEVNCVAFSPTSNLLVSGGNDNKVQLWKIGDVTTSDTLNNGLVNRITCVDISMDGERIVTGCFGGAVQLWDTLTGKPGATLKGHELDVIEVAFSPNGEQVASNSTDKTLRLWCVLAGQLQCVFRGQDKFGYGLAFAPDGTRLVTSYEKDPAIQFWDTQSGEMVDSLQGHTNKIFGTICSPSGV